jgi:hypothetical protein
MQMKGQVLPVQRASAQPQVAPVASVKLANEQNSEPSLLLGSLNEPRESTYMPQFWYVSTEGAGVVGSSHTKVGQGLATPPSQ